MRVWKRKKHQHHWRVWGCFGWGFMWKCRGCPKKYQQTWMDDPPQGIAKKTAVLTDSGIRIITEEPA